MTQEIVHNAIAPHAPTLAIVNGNDRKTPVWTARPIAKPSHHRIVFSSSRGSTTVSATAASAMSDLLGWEGPFARARPKRPLLQRACAAPWAIRHSEYSARADPRGGHD